MSGKPFHRFFQCRLLCVKVAIVGGGPVGIYFAKLCLDQGHNVTLIESGNLHEESKLLSKKNYVFNTPSAMPAGVHRIGGGSTLWRARISEFQQSDFENEDNKEFEQWPFGKDELASHYANLYKLLGAGGFSDEEFLARHFSRESNLLPQSLEMRIFRFCKADFFIKLFKGIQDHPNLDVLEGHLCKNISKSELGNEINLELLQKSCNLKIQSFDSVVISCGTLQSAALLQRSESLVKPDFSNVLGKYLMEHLEGYVGKVWVFRKKDRKFFESMELDNENRAIKAFHGAGVALALRSQKGAHDRKINAHFEFRKPMPILYFQEVKERYAFSVGSRGDTFFRIIIFLERAVSYVLRRLRSILYKIVRVNLYSVYIKAEEIPFKESKSLLADVNDNLLIYEHKVSDVTYEKLYDAISNFQMVFNNHFRAKIKFNKKARSVTGLRTIFGSNWHPMGTTRMGSSISNSIVNSDLQIHGTPNCYVLSASVFPTGSNSNPTFTTLALASRLSETEFFSKSQ